MYTFGELKVWIKTAKIVTYLFRIVDGN